MVPITTVACSGRQQSPGLWPAWAPYTHGTQALTGLTTLLFILALCTLLLEVTQLLGRHTQFSTGEMSWLAGFLGQLDECLGTEG